MTSNNIYHYHHIVPKHMGGTDDPSNLIKLTIEEHAEAHKKLYEEHGMWQDYCAYQSLTNQIDKAEINRLKSVNRDTSYMKTPEYRKTMSEAIKGKPATPGAFKKGYIQPESMRKKRSETRKGSYRIYRDDGSWYWGYPD